MESVDDVEAATAGAAVVTATISVPQAPYPPHHFHPLRHRRRYRLIADLTDQWQNETVYHGCQAVSDNQRCAGDCSRYRLPSASSSTATYWRSPRLSGRRPVASLLYNRAQEVADTAFARTESFQKVRSLTL